MPLSLHAAFVPSALQMLGSTRNLLATAERWCAENDCDHAEIITAKLIDDMFDFAYQVKSVAVHSGGVIASLRKGVFSPDLAAPPDSFGGLRDELDRASAALAAIDEAEMEAMIGQPMRFEFRAYTMNFTAEDFLLSFSQPNFYFHAATAYGILRMKGIPVGKRDFMGALRVAA